MTSASQLARQTPEEHLRLALGATDPEQRLDHARDGLDAPPDELAPDTELLLLRQAYLAHVELHQLGMAVATAEAMAAVGPYRDIAHHDRSRALAALGRMPEAIEAQRMSARHAPPNRKSFQLWSLATLLQFAGDLEGALSTITRGLRYSHKDRPLLKAHAALLRLEAGQPVRKLTATRQALAAAPCGQGYGQYVLGMIAVHLEDGPAATVHLQAFLRRNADIDEPKRLTLREELRRARLALAKFAD